MESKKIYEESYTELVKIKEQLRSPINNEISIVFSRLDSTSSRILRETIIKLLSNHQEIKSLIGSDVMVINFSKLKLDQELSNLFKEKLIEAVTIRMMSVGTTITGVQ